jgi:hypothetical protein
MDRDGLNLARWWDNWSLTAEWAQWVIRRDVPWSSDTF